MQTKNISAAKGNFSWNLESGHEFKFSFQHLNFIKLKFCCRRYYQCWLRLVDSRRFSNPKLKSSSRNNLNSCPNSRSQEKLPLNSYTIISFFEGPDQKEHRESWRHLFWFLGHGNNNLVNLDQTRRGQVQICPKMENSLCHFRLGFWFHWKSSMFRHWTIQSGQFKHQVNH